IVTELVDGGSLRKLIAPGGMDLDGLASVAALIADGLSAAHEAGVVHRDLKPDNILLTREGRPKISDFGLAKTLPVGTSEGGDTMTAAPITSVGMIVGSYSYMSPEQARGFPVDARSDIFSFGLILYELASGHRAFDRRSPVETLAAIIGEDPAEIGRPLPERLSWIIERCLARDPAQRFQSARDLYHDLEFLRDRRSKVFSFAGARVARAARHRWGAIGTVIAAVAASLALAAVLLAPSWPDPGGFVFRPLAGGPEPESGAAWSPRGDAIAFHALVDGTEQVFTRTMDSPTAVQVTRCASPCTRPVWSPDGQSLYLRMQRKLVRIGAAGGEPVPVAPAAVSHALSSDASTLAAVRTTPGNRPVHRVVSSPPEADPVRYQPDPFSTVELSGQGTANIVFSPDSKKLLLWLYPLDPGRSPRFWLLPNPPGNGSPSRLFDSLPPAFPSRGFSWLPDSRFVISRPSAAPGGVRFSSLSRRHFEQAPRLVDGDWFGGKPRGVARRRPPCLYPPGLRLRFGGDPARRRARSRVARHPAIRAFPRVVSPLPVSSCL
ncbi:MAG: protein kinase, partial [Bryobacteraceae bacterium]